MTTEYPYMECPNKHPLDPLEGCEICKGVGLHQLIGNPKYWSAKQSRRPNIRTLSQIECCLRIHYSAVPLEHNPKDVEALLEQGLIERAHNWFTTTEKGRVYVEAIRAVPLPVQKWEMP